MHALRAVLLAVALLGLVPGCELRRHAGEADFANTTPAAMDVYRNDDLQFTLAPGADGTCRLDRDDTFAVREHDSGALRGTHTVYIAGDVVDISMTAIIYPDHVDWSTAVDTDWHTDS